MTKQRLAALYKERREVERRIEQTDASTVGATPFCIGRQRAGLVGERMAIDKQIAAIRSSLMEKTQ